jgi:hypothetical protein
VSVVGGDAQLNRTNHLGAVFRRPCCSCKRIGGSCQAPTFARQIGLNAEQFSAHLLRAGIVTSAAKSGGVVFKIMDVSAIAQSRRRAVRPAIPSFSRITRAAFL